MSKNKLVDVVKNLDGYSQNRLLKFVHSPYHNTHPLVIKLAEYLVNITVFKMEEAFAELYPDTVYQPQKLRNVMSYLQKLVDKFLFYEMMEEQPLQQSIQLLSIYRKEKQRKAFNGIRMQLEKELDQSTIQNADLLYHRFQMHEEDYAYEAAENRLSEKSVQKILDKLDAYFIANRLKYSVFAKSHEAVYKTSYDLGFIEKLMAYAKAEKWQEYPAIQVYFYGYLALTHLEEENYFYQLKNCLKQYLICFDRSEQKDLNLLAINYCIRKINAGNEGFIKDAFEIYELGLQQELFTEEGVFSRFTFKNIVSFALKLEKIDWTRTFIEEYAPLLDKNYQKDYYNYSLAKWHQQKRAYKEALILFQQVGQRDASMHAGTKVSLVKMYYELGEFDALDYALDSFKAFVHRNKQLSDYHKKSYKNFLRFVKKLIQLTTRKERQELKATVQQQKQLPEKQWFYKQL